MQDRTVEYFETLSRRGYEPMLSNVTATIRFDIKSDQQTSSWRLGVDRGKLTVSAGTDTDQAPDDADCMITADKALFEDIAGGANAMAALLRGEIAVSGNPEMLVAVQRLFPLPARVDPSRATADLWPLSPALGKVNGRDV
jgi:hypothetical protein